MDAADAVKSDNLSEPPEASRAGSPTANTADGANTAGGDEKPADPGPPEKLYGTWVANDVDTKLGEVKIQLTFKEEGPVRILAWSDLPFVGQVRNKRAPYEVKGNVIHSDAIRGGTSVEYWFNRQGQLVIRYKEGKTVTFHRA